MATRASSGRRARGPQQPPPAQEERLYEPLEPAAGAGGGGEAARAEAAGRAVGAEPLGEDRALDLALRPRSFAEFIGQSRVVENLALYVEAARRRSRRGGGRRAPLDHVLLSGEPGLGKTTLAHLLAREIGAGLRATSGPAIERPGDLAGVLTNLEYGEVLFIDEIHRLPPAVEEYLYSAMEDFEIDIVLDQGPAARTIKIDLKPFTLVGATTREGLLSAPLRSRFGVLEKLEPYPPDDLERIALRAAGLIGVPLEPAAARLIAERARGSPRVANRFVRRLADVAEVRGRGAITRSIAEQGLGMLGVDEAGLDAMDRKILGVLCRHGGGPLGLKTIAVAVGETEGTIEEVYEPYLIRRGLLVKTPRGRCATAAAFSHLGFKAPRERQPPLPLAGL
ncbi:MAG: Holliday junction ATP-dependent DNA helicase RuvB [Planctomycetota bacterium]|nr:MAG: Holliday junction ATP-dependent DNA helicase RuvB [Planctomycetota bacterium]